MIHLVTMHYDLCANRIEIIGSRRIIIAHEKVGSGLYRVGAMQTPHVQAPRVDNTHGLYNYVSTSHSIISYSGR
jgi:hypothetical protein